MGEEMKANPELLKALDGIVELQQRSDYLVAAYKEACHAEGGGVEHQARCKESWDAYMEVENAARWAKRNVRKLMEHPVIYKGILWMAEGSGGCVYQLPVINADLLGEETRVERKRGREFL
jgi:hypothetical protein